MYIVGWDTLKVAKGDVRRKGDPIPEAAEWPENIRRANLRLGCIILDPKAAALAQKAKVSTVVKAAESSPVAAEDSPPKPEENRNKRAGKRR